MNFAGIGHEFTQLVHYEGDVGASPAGEEVCKGNQCGILGGARGRWIGAVLLAEDDTRLTRQLRGIAVAHSGTFEKDVDGVGLRNKHESLSGFVRDLHPQEALKRPDVRNSETLAKTHQELFPCFHLLAHENEVVQGQPYVPEWTC